MRLIISQRLVRVYASIYLDIRMSISEQGKTKLQLAKAKVITVFSYSSLHVLSPSKIASHIPVFKCYKGLWPLHEMLRQYLGTHKISFGKDKEAEEDENAIPDRKAIQNYLRGLKSQRSRGSQLDEEEDEEGDEEDEAEDEEVKFLPSKKTILKNVSVCLLVLLYFCLWLIEKIFGGIATTPTDENGKVCSGHIICQLGILAS
jgi:hypothetical protein